LNPSNDEKLYYVAQILYVLVQDLVKTSILLLFLRIFPGERFRLVTKVFMAGIICQAIAFFFAVTLQCIPVRAVWDVTVQGQCIDSGAVIAAGAGFSIFEDIAIILLPVPELKRLNLGLGKRLVVMALFAMGSLCVAPSQVLNLSPFMLFPFWQPLTSYSACITSMIRLKYLTTYQIQTADPSCTYSHRSPRAFRILMTQHRGKHGCRDLVYS
jgi:hypothetical protein